MTPLLGRASLRALSRHPWQIVLALLGVALGVAVVVAIDLANQSARRSFALSTSSVVGRATHQIVGGPNGLPEAVYADLRVAGGVRAIAPVVESHVTAADAPGRVFHLLGVDPFAEAPFRPYVTRLGAGAQADVAAFLATPATGLIAAATARQLGLDRGDTLRVRAGTRLHDVTLVGLLEPDATRGSASPRALDHLLVTDIATAQELLGFAGRLSRIDVRVPDGPAGIQVLAAIGERLPAGAEVLRASRRSHALEQMTRAFHLNLTALSLLALIVGVFLIYNTLTFSVVQRRQLIGLLRVQGATRGQVFALILCEAAALGTVGTLLGIGLGVMLGHGLVHLVTRTISDLYYVLAVRDLAVTPGVLAKGVLLGVGASLFAALPPAREATATPPRVTLARSTLEQRARRGAPRAAAYGVLALAVGLGGLWLSGLHLLPTFGSLFGVLLGCVLLTPLATVGGMRLVQPGLSAWGGLPVRLGGLGVVTALSRTAVAVAALMVAVSVTVGVGIMVQSFRQTVVRWLEASLHADVYVAPASPLVWRSDAVLASELIERVAALPGVERMNTYRGARVESRTGLTQVIAIDLGARGKASFQFIAGRPASIWPDFDDPAGRGGRPAVIVSEPYAYRHDLTEGDTLRLRTDRGEQAFRVAGVFVDYGSDQGIVMLSRRVYDAWWDDPRVSSLSLHAAAKTDVDRLVVTLRRHAGTESGIVVRSNRGLRAASLEIFDRTFTITTVLHLLTGIVAFVGVLSALMALQLERAHEFGVLRATGFTPAQVWGMVTAQTGLMGLVAGVLALPVGIGLALILVLVINRRSFGWTLQIEVAPEVMVQAVVMAVVAALLAGIYPALRLARTPPAQALREE